MSRPREPGWEALNAYVDGELPVHASARIARAVASDLETANRVAALTQLKAAVGDALAGAPEIALPPPARPRRRRRLLAAAATVAVMLSAAAASLLGVLAPTGERAAWLARGAAVHRDWDGTAAAAAASARAGVYLEAVARLGPAAFVPDLRAARLRVARIAYLAPAAEGAGGLHVGYVGTRGCRISLWITAAGAR